MRAVLENVCKERLPEHIGLAYTSWAPVGKDGKVPDDSRQRWLESLADLKIPDDYRTFFERWKRSFQSPQDRTWELTLASRMLVGHGNSSATDVGLTVHHTWAVPLIPGTALKGLLAHYVDAVYGPQDPTKAPWEQSGVERERAKFQGNLWQGRRIRRGPGEYYRLLFGAPEADEDQEVSNKGYPAGAASGAVMFHDALYVPGSAPDDKPYAVDVLTVHQKSYYDAGCRFWPNDYTSPNPVAFLTVRPKVNLFFALSGPPDWTKLAQQLLQDALKKWGVGGKTSAGYGRLQAPEAKPAPSSGPRYKRGDLITVTRVADRKGKAWFLADDGLGGQVLGEPAPQVEIGKSLQMWVTNVNPQVYTLTMRDPSKKGKK